MKQILVILCLVMFLAAGCKKERSEEGDVKTALTENIEQVSENIYQYQVTDLYGEPFDFSNLKGKKVMVVNTASECGLTPQYEELQKLYETYKDKNFVIVGFPANNFGGQEPGSDAQNLRI